MVGVGGVGGGVVGVVGDHGSLKVRGCGGTLFKSWFSDQNVDIVGVRWSR